MVRTEPIGIGQPSFIRIHPEGTLFIGVVRDLFTE
jgi:hypothetical protein